MCQCWAVLEGRVPGWCWALGSPACGGGGRQGLTASGTGRRHAGVLTDARHCLWAEVLAHVRGSI